MVAVDMKVFVRELKSFDGRRDVVKAMRRQIRKPLPKVRKSIKAHAISILPSSGGLGKWAAAAKVTATIRYASARSAGVRLRGSRQSEKNRSELSGLDAGQVRAPTWGRREGAGAWHAQTVKPGWFSNPVIESTEWRAEIDNAVDVAFEKIRRG